ncbi:enhancer of polycomb-like protein101 isoform X2 [Zea mays]|uniref:Enhancer of polycomb-like protein n=2 Tax=Zea mays TaxID=4577 RepID=A0A804UDD8_MAIZE|nr:enhancer of polycomb-like protein101 isoform X2 [Zea mays]|eukprot:XP_020396300.1 enhancer of polycomb-like protein101 isoform X2 [Zea mays]
MSRLSFRPRPLDIHKKLPILKSVREFEDEEPGIAPLSSARAGVLLRHSGADFTASGANNATEGEGNQALSKKNAQEIPTPQFDGVDTYERDYTRTFAQPTSYIRGRGARAEIGEFVEYDLDNEDEDWLEEFNSERKNINPEKLEALLFKLEVLDHRARERAGAITPTFIGPVPVLLQLDAAMEALQYLSVRNAVFQAVYNYWKSKRERWQKPILRRLQPPPPVNDTNPYNVFRPREKAHRLHTRRMQRRENNIQSFEKLRLVRRNLEQAKALMDALIKREETKREAMECQVNLQRVQMKYKHEAQLVEDGTTLSGFQQTSSRFESSDDDVDSDDTATEQTYIRPAVFHPRFSANKLSVIPPLRIKRERELKRRPQQNGCVFKRDPEEPVFLFTRPLDPEKLVAAGIKPPPDPPIENGATSPPFRCRGRIGRGGRIIFDRWNPLLRTPIDQETYYVPYGHRPPSPEGAKLALGESIVS